MAHYVQCRICKIRFDTEQLGQNEWIMPSKNWYYHTSCYESFAKKKGALKENDLTVEVEDDLWMSAVYDYLTKDLKMSLNYVKFKGQWASYLKKGMTAKGIYFTLRYFYEIKKGDTQKSENGIGIVPFIYEEGTCYWGERNQRDKNICARIEAEIRKDFIQREQTKIVLQKRVKQKAAIDFSVIGEDDEG